MKAVVPEGEIFQADVVEQVMPIPQQIMVEQELEQPLMEDPIPVAENLVV